MKFSELGLHDTILEAISYMGFEDATPIQERAIPAILNGRDLMACAQTGTGKTAAFILPVLDQISRTQHKGTSVLVIVPTRELAVQIDEQIQGFAYFTNAHSATVYGGGNANDFDKERVALTNGTDIIVATPGKLLAHLNLGYVKFDSVSHLILDEADRMLDMGFYEDIEKIMSYLPSKRQNLMFSATMPPKIRQLAHKTLVEPEEITISLSKPAEGVTQRSYLTFDDQKIPLIEYLLQQRPDYNSIIIFCSKKRKVNEVVSNLRKVRLAARAISSDLEQQEREEVLMKFRSKSLRILVATDVLSRGIDIKDINLVINFDVPNNPEDYVHRIGRTARAETKGEAITLVNQSDFRKFSHIERLIEKTVPREAMPEQFGPAPEWVDQQRKPRNNNQRKPKNGQRSKGPRRDGQSAQNKQNRSSDNNKPSENNA